MSKPKTPSRVVPIEEKIKDGRPRKVAPPDAADIIRHACSVGSNKRGVAMALGTSVDVLVRWLEEDPALKEAFDEGRETERKTLHTVLYTAATTGVGKDSLIAAMFLLKARHGYQEGQQENQANRVSINFTLPGAMRPDQFTIENHDSTSDSTQRLPTKNITRS